MFKENDNDVPISGEVNKKSKISVIYIYIYIYIYKITYVERDFKRYEMNVAIMCVCERERVIKSASGKPKIFLLSIHSPS